MSDPIQVSEDQIRSDARKDENGRVLEHEQEYVMIVPDYVIHSINSAKDEILGAVKSMVTALQEEMNQRFDGVDKRLDEVEVRLTEVENNLHSSMEQSNDNRKLLIGVCDRLKIDT